MSRFVLLRTKGATLLGESPLIRAETVGQVERLAKLVDDVDSERADLAAARAEAERRGYEEGKTDGRLAGEAAARAEAADLVGSALQTLHSYRRTVRDDAIDLAMAIAERVLPSVAGDRALAELVETAARELQEDPPHTVRVHPTNVDRLRSLLAAMDLEVEADPSIREDSAVLDSDSGSAEAGLAARLGVLREALHG